MVAKGRDVQMAASDACVRGQSHGADAAAEVANANHQPRTQAEQRDDAGLKPP